MSPDDIDKTHPGFDDHHHIELKKSDPTPFDPDHQAERAVKDTAWDILQGKTPTIQDEPGTIVVPDEYVHTVATCCIRQLNIMGCSKGFSVKIDPDEPIVKTTWMRAETLARAGAGLSGYELETDCAVAYVNQLDPIDVGMSAAKAFIAALEKARLAEN